MTDSLPAWVRVAGPPAAPPLLLVSGLGGTAGFWQPIQSILAAHFRVASFDQPGCGKRPAPERSVTIESLALDAEAISRQVFGERPVTVIGHSTGGTIAQTLAATRGDLVNALVLSGTWQKADHYMQALFAFRTALLRQAPDLSEGFTTLLTRDPSEITKNALDPHPLAAPSAAIAIARIKALLAFDGTPLMPSIQVPSLVLGAQDDRIVPGSLQLALHAGLAHSALHMLPDGGHFFPISRLHHFTRHVEDWLADKAVSTPKNMNRTYGRNA